MNTKSSIFTSGGVHEWNTIVAVFIRWNKIRSYTEKKFQIFCFFYAFIYNN